MYELKPLNTLMPKHEIDKILVSLKPKEYKAFAEYIHILNEVRTINYQGYREYREAVNTIVSARLAIDSYDLLRKLIQLSNQVSSLLFYFDTLNQETEKEVSIYFDISLFIAAYLDNELGNYLLLKEKLIKAHTSKEYIALFEYVFVSELFKNKIRLTE